LILSKMFNLPPFKQLQEQIRANTDEHVQRSLNASHLSPAALAALLSPAADRHLESMALRSAEITALRFGRTTQIYAPLYVSSFCTNRCSYCGFSADNKIERRLLSLEEAEAEAMLLHQRGFNHILLVSGEAPAKLGVDYLENLARRLRDHFASVSIEVQPLATEEYSRLFNAGITSVAIYQETYDRATYEKVHLSGQKCNFDFRLATPARAAAGSMREVGIGALLGLSDWRAEGLALGLHLAWLRKNFWRTALTVSFPRLRPAAGEFQPLYEVTERDLSHLIFALRLFDPDVGIVLSTREEARYRNGMIGLGPTRYSAGSCTAPGGYSNPDITGEQFTIGDHRTIDEVCAAIRQKGFDPVRKDWDAGFQALSS
jgi:2-iminoacetate synthase